MRESTIVQKWLKTFISFAETSPQNSPTRSWQTNAQLQTLATQVVSYHFCQFENAPTCSVPEFVHSMVSVRILDFFQDRQFYVFTQNITARAVEADGQGVQLHTHFLSLSSSRNQIWYARIWIYFNKLPTQILVASIDLALYY